MAPAERCRERLLEPFLRPGRAGAAPQRRVFHPCGDSSPGYSVNRPLQSGRGVWLGSGGFANNLRACDPPVHQAEPWLPSSVLHPLG